MSTTFFGRDENVRLNVFVPAAPSTVVRSSGSTGRALLIVMGRIAVSDASLSVPFDTYAVTRVR